MGIFGDLDVDEIPDDPNFVEKGPYGAYVARTDIVERRDGSATMLKITFCIDEPSSKYHGYYPQKWLDLNEDFNPATDEETPEIRKGNAKMMRTLKALEITIEQMKTMTAQQMIVQELFKKKRCVIIVSNYERDTPGGGKGTNVYDVLPADAEYTLAQ